MKFGAIALMAATLAASAPAMAAAPVWTETHTYNSSEFGVIDPIHYVALTAGWYDLSVALQGYGVWVSSVSALLIEKTSGTAVTSATTGVTGSVPNNSSSTLYHLLTDGTYGIAFNGGSFGNSATGTATLTNVTPVPCPEAGAGLGALALGGMALYKTRRRKVEAETA